MPTGEQTYRAAGFLLRALGRKLAVPAQMRTRYVELGWTPQPPEPDLLFQHASSSKHLVLECKATSFSSESTTAQQARKLLSLCADPNCCAGAKAALIVTYVISGEDTQQQLKTLEELTVELDALGFDVADSGTLGLAIEDDTLWATLTLLSPGRHRELMPIEGRIQVTAGVDGDVRPLYIVPYDPAAADNQLADERDYCARQLTERILNFATSVVGRAATPDIVSIDPIDAIKQATFGVSDRWLSRDVDTLRHRVEEELFRVLHRGMPEKVELTGRKVHVNLLTEEDQQTALSLLQKARPQHVAHRLLDPQLRLIGEVSPT
ncbi:hypothetical protein [Micromonospora chersina]